MSEINNIKKQYSGIITFPIYRPVTTIMIFATIGVFGWQSYQKLPINLMPDISYPSLTVRTEFEGAAPEDVEKLVTRPLEEMLGIVSGLVEISSVSSVGLSEITLEFLWNTEMNIAQQDVRDRLDLFEPPKEVTKKPVILRFNPNLDPVIRIGMTPPNNMNDEDKNQYLTTLRESVQRRLKSDLEAEVGIAQVDVKGGQEEEIQILVDSKMLKSLGISLEDIVRSLASQNINIAGGKLVEGKTEYIVRTLKEFKDIEDIKNVIISTSAGLSALDSNSISAISSLQSITSTSSNTQNISDRTVSIRLKDVAIVRWGNKERDTIIRINGEDAIELEIYKEGDSNTVTVCNLVKDLLGIERKKSFSELLNEQISLAIQTGPSSQYADGKGPFQASTARREQIKKKTLLGSIPSGTKTHIISDQSQFIISSIEEVQSSAVNGGLLSLLILYLFLRELRSTLTIGFAIPISIIIVFIPMFMRDISLNIMSLGGLALGIGMLVDNSIVVLESVARCREEGDSVLGAAIRGTSEIGAALTSSTLTTVTVFFPVAFVEGIAGQIFGDLALTVTFSLLASLFVALFFDPLIVSKTHFEFGNRQNIFFPIRTFLYYRNVRHRRFLTSLLLTSLLVLKKHIKKSKSHFSEIFKYKSSNSKIKNVLKVLFFPFNILLRLISWIILNFIIYPGITLVTIIILPFVILTILIYIIIRKILYILFYLPLEVFNIGFNAFRYIYRVSLSQSLRFSPLFILLAIILFIYAISILPRLGQELIPTMKQGEFNILFETRAGTKLEQTLQKALRIEEKLKEHPLIERITLQVGSTDSSKSESKGTNENKASFTILLKNRSETAQIQDKIIDEIRSTLIPLPEESITFSLPTLFTLKTDLEVQIFGDDLNILKTVGEKCLQKVKEVNGVKDADISIQPGYPELLIQLDRELLAERGLTPAQIANKLRTEIQGEIATKFNRGGDKIDIRVRTDQALLKSINDLQQLSIVEGAVPVRLCDIAKIVEDVGPSDIRRIGQKRVALITANIEGRDLASVSNEVLGRLREVEKPREFFITLGGQNRELSSSYQSLQFALFLALFLVYVVMACQFESIWLPLLIMFSIPLAFVGVILTLFWTNTNLDVMVFLGSIILAGIVVNNAIVLLDYTEQLVGRGYSLHDAIVQASVVRLRPIFMTTLTTVLGLLPMLISHGEGSELRQPLALTVIAGLSSSTLLTLWVIPMAYYMFSNLVHRKKR